MKDLIHTSKFKKGLFTIKEMHVNVQKSINGGMNSNKFLGLSINIAIIMSEKLSAPPSTQSPEDLS